MNDRNLHLLASPGVLIGLSLLLLNDLILKSQFHNGLTGKLSDVAGLFVFPLFWAAFFPRSKPLIYVTTALLFTFWKSVYAQPLIDGWNAFSYFSIGRTVDYSDLVALTVLPISYAYGRVPSGFRIPRPALYMIAVVSLFAFTATSYSQKVSYNNEYQFQTTKKELLKTITRLPAKVLSDSLVDADSIEIGFNSCTSNATVSIHENNSQSVLTLREINYRCPGKADKQKMLDYFEAEFINRLREDPVVNSTEVESIRESSSSINKRIQPSPDQQRKQDSRSPR